MGERWGTWTLCRRLACSRSSLPSALKSHPSAPVQGWVNFLLVSWYFYITIRERWQC